MWKSVLPHLCLAILMMVACTSSFFKSVTTQPSSDCDEHLPNGHCTLPHSDIQSSNESTEPASMMTVQYWGGRKITTKDHEHIRILRARTEKQSTLKGYEWLEFITDIEILRFLHARSNHVEEAWKMLLAHAEWRSSTYGADSYFTTTQFTESPLNHEVFWLGYNKDGCPTLVIRTQVHDGIYYREDPHIFGSFLTNVLEQGRHLYGVGTERQMCVLMDRAGTVWRNGKQKEEKLDMAVVPNLVILFRHLYSTITNNYPEIVDSVKIAPASWFFSMCYRITSRVLDARSRSKFLMIKDHDVKAKLHSVIDPAQLPAHLYGTSTEYQSKLDIYYTDSSMQFADPSAQQPPEESWKRTAATTTMRRTGSSPGGASGSSGSNSNSISSSGGNNSAQQLKSDEGRNDRIVWEGGSGLVWLGDE